MMIRARHPDAFRRLRDLALERITELEYLVDSENCSERALLRRK
jgi:hypothetical protein